MKNIDIPLYYYNLFSLDSRLVPSVSSVPPAALALLRCMLKDPSVNVNVTFNDLISSYKIKSADIYNFGKNVMDNIYTRVGGNRDDVLHSLKNNGIHINSVDSTPAILKKIPSKKEFRNTNLIMTPLPAVYPGNIMERELRAITYFIGLLMDMGQNPDEIKIDHILENMGSLTSINSNSQSMGHLYIKLIHHVYPAGIPGLTPDMLTPENTSYKETPFYQALTDKLLSKEVVPTAVYWKSCLLSSNVGYQGYNPDNSQFMTTRLIQDALVHRFTSNSENLMNMMHIYSLAYGEDFIKVNLPMHQEKLCRKGQGSIPIDMTLIDNQHSFARAISGIGTYNYYGVGLSRIHAPLSNLSQKYYRGSREWAKEDIQKIMDNPRSFAPFDELYTKFELNLSDNRLVEIIKATHKYANSHLRGVLEYLACLSEVDIYLFGTHTINILALFTAAGVDIQEVLGRTSANKHATHLLKINLRRY